MVTFDFRSATKRVHEPRAGSSTSASGDPWTGAKRRRLEG